MYNDTVFNGVGSVNQAKGDIWSGSMFRSSAFLLNICCIGLKETRIGSDKISMQNAKAYRLY